VPSTYVIFGITNHITVEHCMLQRIFGRSYVMYINYANFTFQVCTCFKITKSLDV